MKARSGFGAKLDIGLMAQRAVKFGFSLKTIWAWEKWRLDNNGIYRCVDSWSHGNLITNEGLDAILDIMFHGSTQITTWYFAPFEDDYTPLATNTYAVPGYTECTAYDEANRQAFVEGAASGQSISNSGNRAALTISATKTLYGSGLVGGGTDADTKGDTAGGGTLVLSGAFDASKEFEDDEVALIKLTITASDV